MNDAQYLLLMAGCLAITLPLEFVLGARVYRSPRRLGTALLPGFIVFTGWDLYAILSGAWTFNPRYVTGAALGPIPVEELVFFVVIPVCGLLTYEAVGNVLALARGRGKVRFRWPDGLVRDRQTGSSRHG